MVTTNLNGKRTVAAAAAMSGRGPIVAAKTIAATMTASAKAAASAAASVIAGRRESAPSALMRSSVFISTPSETPLSEALWRSPPGRDAAPP